MAKLVAVFALLALLPVVGEAGTLSGCLPSSLPTVPVPPVFALDTSDRADDNAHLDIWRHACLDGSGSAVLIRLMPTSLAAHVCYVDFSVVQAGTEFRVDLHWSPSGLFLCGTIVAPVTAYLTTWGPAVPFDNTRAFTLVYRDGFARRSVEIPTAGSAPPSIRVVASGCVTCHPGDTLGVDVFVDNPGPSMLVEIKTAARLPDDSVVSILERHKEVMLLSAEDLVPGGVMVIPLVADFALPAGIPAGTYTIEAALLEPKLGVTLSRHKVSFTVAP